MTLIPGVISRFLRLNPGSWTSSLLLSDLGVDGFDAFRAWLGLTGEAALLESALAVSELLERCSRSAMVRND